MKHLIFFICSVVLISQSIADTPQLLDESNILKHRAPFPGYLYSPLDQPVKGAILFLHGSEGGNGDFWNFPGLNPESTGANTVGAKTARLYASRGYVAYALCYFDCEKGHVGYDQYPPNELVQVDIEQTIHRTLSWLKKSQLVNGKKVALRGASRGGELAILYGSLSAGDPNLTTPDAIISLSPIEFTGSGFSLGLAQSTFSGEDYNYTPLPSWSYKSKPILPNLPIEIEKYKGPLFVSYFQKDPVWQAGEPWKLMDRLIKSGIEASDINHLVFKNTDKPTPPLKIGSSTPRVFLEFEGSGHVAPPRDSKGFDFYLSAVNEFNSSVFNQRTNPPEYNELETKLLKDFYQSLIPTAVHNGTTLSTLITNIVDFTFGISCRSATSKDQTHYRSAH